MISLIPFLPGIAGRDKNFLLFPPLFVLHPKMVDAFDIPLQGYLNILRAVHNLLGLKDFIKVISFSLQARNSFGKPAINSESYIDWDQIRLGTGLSWPSQPIYIPRHLI